VFAALVFAAQATPALAEPTDAELRQALVAAWTIDPATHTGIPPADRERHPALDLPGRRCDRDRVIFVDAAHLRFQPVGGSRELGRLRAQTCSTGAP
jgi:hypothetical protein